LDAVGVGDSEQRWGPGFVALKAEPRRSIVTVATVADAEGVGDGDVPALVAAATQSDHRRWQWRLLR